MAYKVDLSEMLGWVEAHPLIQKRVGLFATWEFYLNIRNLNVLLFTVDVKTRSYQLSYYLKPFYLKGQYGITVGMPNNCPVAHDDACRNRRLLDKMFTCLVDQINAVADRAHAYGKKKGA